MASNGGPPSPGRDRASNSGSNGGNDAADNSNTTTSNNQASLYVPARPAPRPPAARPPTAAERAQFNNFQFPRESFESLDRGFEARLPINNQRLPIYRQRPLSGQPSPLDIPARVGGASPAPPSTGVNGVVGREGQGQGEQGAARRQSYSYRSLPPLRPNATAEDTQRLAEIRARTDAIVDAAMAGRTTIDPERRGEIATRQREVEEDHRRMQNAQGSSAEDMQRRAEIIVRAGAMVDAAMAGRTTIDSGSSGRERARQREGEEEHRLRQDAQVNGAGAGVEDEHAEDKE